MKIAVTGAKGFIGKNLVTAIKASKSKDEVITVEKLRVPEWDAAFMDDPYFPMLDGLTDFHMSEFIDALSNGLECDRIIHLGAVSSTQANSPSEVLTNNLICSIELYKIARQRQIPFIYASSAAVYGHGGIHGFSDLPRDSMELKPLNLYGYSKLWFDNWLWNEYKHDWAVGLRFFNVYGPGENHKGNMGSIVTRAYHQIKQTGKVTLLEDPRENSLLPMARDMVFIGDVINVIAHFIHNPHRTGIYNVGTGKDTTWEEAAQYVFSVMGLPENIEYKPFPENMRKGYQWNTRANLTNLYRMARYPYRFVPISLGVKYTVQTLIGAEQNV